MLAEDVARALKSFLHRYMPNYSRSHMGRYVRKKFAVEIERAFLAELGSGCSMPVGAHVDGGTLWTFLADLDTGISVSDEIDLPGGPGDVEIARAAARGPGRLRRWDGPTSQIPFNPLPRLDRQFESVCLNYVLHCLPGSCAQRERVIANLKTVMTPEGVLFGSTILGAAAAINHWARAVLKYYNFIGSFHNTHDTAEDLEAALTKHFQYRTCRVIGSVALFAASDGKL